MKICLLNNLYKPYDRGGAEKVVEASLEKFHQEGHDVFIITTKPKRSNLASPTNAKIFYIASNFYNLHKIPAILRLFWHFDNILSFKKYHEISKILQTEKPDLIISHNLMGLGFMTAQAIKQVGCKHYHFLHDIQLLHPSGLMFFSKEKNINSQLVKIYQKITKIIFDSPQKIISPSDWLLKEHLKRGFFPKSNTEIKPLADIFNIRPTIKTKTEKKSVIPKKLLFAGQLEHHKGILFLLKAFIDLAESDMELNIAGDGQLKKLLIKLSDSKPNIKILGKLNKKELTQKMEHSDILIMPSLCYENSPTIILEAQAVGLPVIASRLGGIPEIIGPNDSLFNPGDAYDLFKQLKNPINL